MLSNTWCMGTPAASSMPDPEPLRNIIFMSAAWECLLAGQDGPHATVLVGIREGNVMALMAISSRWSGTNFYAIATCFPTRQCTRSPSHAERAINFVSCPDLHRTICLNYSGLNGYAWLVYTAYVYVNIGHASTSPVTQRMGPWHGDSS